MLNQLSNTDYHRGDFSTHFLFTFIQTLVIFGGKSLFLAVFVSSAEAIQNCNHLQQKTGSQHVDLGTGLHTE